MYMIYVNYGFSYCIVLNGFSRAEIDTRWFQEAQGNKMDVSAIYAHFHPFSPVSKGPFYQNLGMGSQKEVREHLFNQEHLFSTIQYVRILEYLKYLTPGMFILYKVIPGGKKTPDVRKRSSFQTCD